MLEIQLRFILEELYIYNNLCLFLFMCERKLKHSKAALVSFITAAAYLLCVDIDNYRSFESRNVNTFIFV